MASITGRVFKRVRFKIPFFFDVINVYDPDQIQKIDRSDAVDRLHAFPTKDLPFWLKAFFRATRFHDFERDLWFLSLEPNRNPDSANRRVKVKHEVDRLYSPADVENIADLIRGGAGDREVAHAMVQIVNTRFFGREIPPDVTRKASRTLQDFGEMVLPWRYFRARKAQRELMSYYEEALKGKGHLVDLGHNIGETVQTTTAALRLLSRNLDTPVCELFTKHALTAKVPRITTRATTFDGLLQIPTVPGKTVLLLQIQHAAEKTGDIEFTFGTGVGARSCVFKDFFLQFMQDLQDELKKARPGSGS